MTSDHHVGVGRIVVAPREGRPRKMQNLSLDPAQKRLAEVREESPEWEQAFHLGNYLRRGKPARPPRVNVSGRVE